MAKEACRAAVIDIGSNSTRLFVADVEDGTIARREKRSTVTRLGRGVDLAGHLSAEAIETTCEVIGRYLAIAEEEAAELIEPIATSAVRDASNGEAFIAELRERFSISARVLDGEEEARLTYLGATHERAAGEPTLVIDIGGGSTELVVGRGGQIDFHASLQAGVVRHTERHVGTDPPTSRELEALAADARALIAEAVSGGGPRSVRAGVAVAGTPTSLAAIELALEPYDPARVHGHVLSLTSIQRMLSQLASTPLREREQIAGLHPDRAPTIVAGVVILIEAMRAFSLDEIEVYEHDILYGAALDAVERCHAAQSQA